jgi:hypothetical protein
VTDCDAFTHALAVLRAHARFRACTLARIRVLDNDAHTHTHTHTHAHTHPHPRARARARKQNHHHHHHHLITPHRPFLHCTHISAHARISCTRAGGGSGPTVNRLSAKPRPGFRVVSVPYWHALLPTHPLALPNTTSFYFWPKAKGLAIGTLHFTMQDGQQLHLVLRATSARPRLEIANDMTVGPLKYVLRPLRITLYVYNNNGCAF